MKLIRSNRFFSVSPILLGSNYKIVSRVFCHEEKVLVEETLRASGLVEFKVGLQEMMLKNTGIFDHNAGDEWNFIGALCLTNDSPELFTEKILLMRQLLGEQFDLRAPVNQQGDTLWLPLVSRPVRARYLLSCLRQQYSAELLGLNRRFSKSGGLMAHHLMLMDAVTGLGQGCEVARPTAYDSLLKEVLRFKPDLEQKDNFGRTPPQCYDLINLTDIAGVLRSYDISPSRPADVFQNYIPADPQDLDSLPLLLPTTKKFSPLFYEQISGLSATQIDYLFSRAVTPEGVPISQTPHAQILYAHLDQYRHYDKHQESLLMAVNHFVAGCHYHGFSLR